MKTFIAKPAGHSQLNKNVSCEDGAFFNRGVEMKKRKLLLHSCCGPCSTSVIDRLINDYDITVFFYNPNITDEPEYVKRRETQKEFIDRYNHKNNGTVTFIDGDYEPEKFFYMADGLEDEPEGGMRCPLCFEMRLKATADKALELGIKLFATTLTVSPHKNYPIISAIGREIALDHNLEFLDLDFKKQAGFQKSIEMSKEYEMYRQDYCGCEFSKWWKNKKDEEIDEQ